MDAGLSERIPRQRLRFIKMHKELIGKDFGFITYEVGRVTNCLCGMKITGNYVFQDINKNEVVLGSTCAKRYRALKEAPEHTKRAILEAEKIIASWDRQTQKGKGASNVTYTVMKRAFYLKVRRLNSALLYVDNLKVFLSKLDTNANLLNDFEKKVLKTVKSYGKQGEPSLKQLRILVNADLRIGDAELLTKVTMDNNFIRGLKNWVKQRPLTWNQLMALERTIAAQATSTKRS